MLSVSYKLDNNGIKQSTEKIEGFLTSNDVSRSEILRTALAVEEVLLNYMNEFSGDMSFSVNHVKSFGKFRIELIISCEAFDPFAGKNDEEGYIIHKLMMNTGLEPSCEKAASSAFIYFSDKYRFNRNVQ